jgi:long-chain acyl-CoA synthetase
MTRDTIPDRVQNFGRTLGNKAAMHYYADDVWHAVSWAEYAHRSRVFAGALLANGYEPGDGVAILSDNCPEWLIAEMGAMMARAVAAGIYQTCTPEQTAYIAQHCEAKVVVVQDPTQWTKFSSQRSALPKLRKVVLLTGADEVDDALVCSFDEFMEEGEANLEAADARFAEVQDDDLAVLIYTSGTTGPPKGVMLSHHNLAWTAQQTNVAAGATVTDNDCVVSYLPLSHIAEQLFSIHLPATYGFPVWFAGSVDRLKDTLGEARPTLFLAVPRVWEKFKAALEAKLSAATGLKSVIVNWARNVGLKAGPKLIEEGKVGGLLGLQYSLANRLFYSKLTAQLGLDRLELAVTGAAPIGKDVLDFFMSCGIIIHEVYGQSEDSGPTTFNQPKAGHRKLGTVGIPFPGVDVRIADDGEICVRGPNVFKGYYKNPEATAEALVDGWLHSGDIGEFDADGFLRITDRKKDLIITAGGKNVAPQNIEKLLRRIPAIGQAVVIGDKRKFLTALLTIDGEGGSDYAATKGWPADVNELAAHKAFRDHVQAGVDEANAELARYETIKRFVILPEDFTVEGGELTPTQKVKRKVVHEKYSDDITGLYADVT